MNKLPVLEFFGEPGAYALQGEGMFAGTPSVFVRTFGCNLRCKFGLKENEYKDWEKLVKSYSDKYDQLEELPVLSKGCDTYYSIFPEYRKFIKEYEVQEMFNELKERTNNFSSKINLVITGGESLLPKYQYFWSQVFNQIDTQIDDYFSVTFETNGTYELNFDADSYEFIEINFSISPKLKNSGHSYLETINPKAVLSYYNACNEIWFKFVGADYSIVDEIKDVIELYGLDDIPVYIMPEGGSKKELELHQELVYNICSEYGFRYSGRLQVSIKNNGIGI